MITASDSSQTFTIIPTITRAQADAMVGVVVDAIPTWFQTLTSATHVALALGQDGNTRRMYIGYQSYSNLVDAFFFATKLTNRYSPPISYYAAYPYVFMEYAEDAIKIYMQLSGANAKVKIDALLLI